MNISVASNFSKLESNRTFTRYNDQPHYSLCKTYDLVIECIIISIFILFGFVGNSLSIFCLWKDKSKTATPALLINLEMAETLFLLTALLLRSVPTAYNYSNPGTTNSEWSFTYYQILFPLARSFQTCAIYSTILVTVNRYVAVCYPYRAKNLCSKKQATGQILVVWILSIIFNIPLFYEFQMSEHDNHIESRFSDNFKIIYNNVMYFIVMFFIPLISLIFLNYKLVVALKRMKRRRILMKHRVTKDSSNRKQSTTTANRSEEEITYVLIVIVFVFIFSQTPALLTQIFKIVYEFYLWYLSCPSFFFFFERISDMLVVMTSSVNFIIYIFCSSRFMNILLSLLQDVRVFMGRQDKRVATVHTDRRTNTNLTPMQPCHANHEHHTLNEEEQPLNVEHIPLNEKEGPLNEEQSKY